jgi:hypothetical protein
MVEFHFRSMEASNIESDVTIQLLVWGLVIHFAGIFHEFCSAQKLLKIFMVLHAAVETFFNFGAHMTLKLFLQISTKSTHQKALPQKNLRRLRHYAPGGCFGSGCRGPEE